MVGAGGVGGGGGVLAGELLGGKAASKIDGETGVGPGVTGASGAAAGAGAADGGVGLTVGDSTTGAIGATGVGVVAGVSEGGVGAGLATVTFFTWAVVQTSMTAVNLSYGTVLPALITSA
jgi:hypothetical protein